MKRDSRGEPVMMMVHRWKRPLSCLPCREKKRRCDRIQPCSNCSQRNIECEYDQGHSVAGPAQPATEQAEPATLNAEDVLNRLHKLEEAVFNQSQPLPQRHADTHNVTPFGFHLQYTVDKPSLDIAYLTRNLPPIEQARELFSHFSNTLHATICVFHIPSTRSLMEETYQRMMLGEQPTTTSLLLLFTIFAGAALAWTPDLLEKLRSTKEEAKAAFTAYTRFAISILDDDSQSIPSSTVALAAINNLAYLITNSDGFAVKANVIRIRCLLMARAMQIHRLDTVKSQEERRKKGCNMIEIEVQRRVWWHMVATDWLSGFSGGPQEGSYSLQPKHMNVNYPSNVDDEFITETNVEYNHPLSTPTAMSSFIYRIKMAEICREIVDAMPSSLLESQEPEYDLILQLDDKYRTFFDNLPTFLQDDETSISQSQGIYEKYRHLPLQRITIHFSVHTRICRLHRPYHLEGTTNPKYAYSHQMCIRSAQKVLELRRAMDDASAKVGIKPTRFWVVTQHVFLAALILATDVSFNPDAVDAEARKEKVLSAYRILERSKEESSVLVEGIQRNMQTLMATLQKQRAQTDLQTGSAADRIDLNDGPQFLPTMDRPSDAFIDTDLGDWDSMWSEFLAVAPELDAPQWNSLLDDMDLNLPEVQ